MSYRHLLTKEEIVSMYMGEWYRSHHDNQGTRRPASEIEQKSQDIIVSYSLATAAVERRPRFPPSEDIV